MKIEDLNVEIRPRMHWESVDLGIRMVQKQLVGVYLPYLIVLLPLYLLAVIPQWSNAWVFLLILWWFKPLFDRIPLFVLSRTMFGQTPTVRETLTVFPSLLKFSKLAGAYLLIYRFSPNRAVHLPIHLLEDLPANKREARTTILSKRLGNMPLFLTSVFLMFEIILWLSLDGATEMMIPSNLEFNWMEAGNVWFMRVQVTFYFVTVFIMEPLYVGACFALYLNCRILSEGWDLELAFRRLANRLTSHQGITLVLLALGLSLLTPSAHALPAPQATAETAQANQDPAQVIKRVMEDPVFNRTQTKEELRFKESKDDQPIDFEKKAAQPTSDGLSSSALASISALIRGLVMPLMWLLLLAFILFVIVQFLKFRPAMTGKKSKKQPPPVKQPQPSRFSQEILAQPLPDDIVTTARDLMAKGNERGALGLLFRGALVALDQKDLLKIADCATEMECLNQVRSTVPEAFAAFFTRLVKAWLMIAYSHATLEPLVFERLCDDWRRYLEAEA